MESSFEKADSRNLPSVSMDMVHQFTLSNVDYFAPEVRGTKMKRSTRDSYGDKAIGYVQLKRSNNHCFVKCRVTPEHKIRQKAYTCIVDIDEQALEVVTCKCEDCAASEGGCKHALAFLYWLHRRSEEPSVTEIKSYWQKPKLADSKKEFVTCKDFPGQCEKSNLSTDFLQKVLAVTPASSDIQVVKYFKSNKSKSFLELASLHHLMWNFKTTKKAYDAEAFLQFCSQQLTDLVCRNVCHLTMEQSLSPLWHEIRFGRITASIIYDVSRCKTQGTLLQRILGASTPFETEATLRGQKLEKLVIKEVENIKNIK